MKYVFDVSQKDGLFSNITLFRIRQGSRLETRKNLPLAKIWEPFGLPYWQYGAVSRDVAVLA